jgi:hypothetical protein
MQQAAGAGRGELAGGDSTDEEQEGADAGQQEP